MKRYLIVFLFAVALPVIAVAQDKIWTMDGEPIVASVKEITDKTISYKKWERPDGPVYRLKRSFVARIEYKDGTIEYYAQKPPKKVEQAAPEQTPVVQTPKEEPVAQTTPVTQPQTSQVPAVQTAPTQQTPVNSERVIMHNGKLYFATGRQLNEYEQRIYLGNMYSKFEKQQFHYKLGLGLLCGGSAVMLLGTILWVTNDAAGWATFSIAGIVCDIVAIPLIVIGDKKRKQIYQDRATQGGYVAPTAQLTFGSQHYGVGLAIKF